MMDVSQEIINKMVVAKKQGIEFNAILVGEKEMEAMKLALNYMSGTEIQGGISRAYGNRVFRVNEESFLKVAYVID